MKKLLCPAQKTRSPRHGGQVGPAFELPLSGIPVLALATGLFSGYRAWLYLRDCNRFNGRALGSMPRYYFDSRDGDGCVPDNIGLEFDSIEGARDEAARILPEMARFVLPASERRELAIEVKGADGEPLLRTSLVFETERLG